MYLRGLEPSIYRRLNSILAWSSSELRRAFKSKQTLNGPVDGSCLVSLMDRLQSLDSIIGVTEVRSLIDTTFYFHSKTNLQCISRVDMLTKHGLQVGIRKGTG